VSSRTQATHSDDAAKNVTARVSCISFSDVSECGGIAEYVDGFLKLGQIFRADQYSSSVAVARHDDAFVLVFNAVDYLAEVVADRS